MAGCGDDVVALDAGDSGFDGDADAADSATFMPTPPAPPEPPALPSFGECPRGWTAVDVSGAQSCEPWPEGWEGCPDDQVRFPGDASCAALGSACPADGWPSALPATGTVHHVREGETGGDGTRSTPYGTIAEAIAVAMPGDTIAVAVGTYPEAVTIPEDVALIGACASETTIDPPMGDLAAVGVLMSAGTSIANVTVAGQRPGVRGAAGEVRISDVLIRAALVGLAATNGATVLAERIAIRDTDDRSMGVGFGLFINNGARVEIRRGVIQRSTSSAVGLMGATQSAFLEDVAIMDVALRPDGGLGNGIALDTGGSLELHRTVVERVHGSALYLANGATGMLDTFVARDVDSDTLSGTTGYGIGLNVGGTLVADRVHLTRTTTTAFAMIGFDLDVTVRDLIIEEVGSQPSDMRGGIGLLFDSLDSARFERVLMTGTKGAAIAALSPDTVVEIDDLTTLDLAPEESGELGVAAAVEARDGVELTIRRMHSPSSLGATVIVNDPDSRLTLEDALLENNAPTSMGAGGRGVSAQLGARFDCTRCEIRSSSEVAIMATGPGGTSTLRDVRLEATEANPDNGAGMGLVALDGAQIDMERFVVADNAVAGIQLVAEPHVVARDGLIANNPVGVNAQDATVDPADLSDRVLYQDNGLNLDSTALPVPSGGF
jgi:hypothetical protein